MTIKSTSKTCKKVRGLWGEKKFELTKIPEFCLTCNTFIFIIPAIV